MAGPLRPGAESRITVRQIFRSTARSLERSPVAATVQRFASWVCSAAVSSVEARLATSCLQTCTLSPRSAGAGVPLTPAAEVEPALADAVVVRERVAVELPARLGLLVVVRTAALVLELLVDALRAAPCGAGEPLPPHAATSAPHSAAPQSAARSVAAPW